MARAAAAAGTSARWSVTALLVALCTCFALAAASDVVKLTDENFAATVKGEPAILVEFFAPWCGHCKALAPKYEDAATKLKGIAKIAQVDCTVENEVCTQQGVRGYPTIKLFRGDPAEATDYPGAREADAIVSFMKKQVSPALSTVAEADVATFADSDKVVVVAFFAEASGAAFEEFSTLANANRDSYTFGYVVDADGDTAKEHGASVPGVVLFKKFDERKNVYSGDFDAEDLLTFIKGNSVPLMDDIGPDNYASYAESGVPLAYLFVGSDEDRKTHGPGVEAIAKDYKGKINFVYLDAAKYGGHANNLNLKQEWPAFAIQRPLDGTKFPFDQSAEFNVEAIRAFVEDFATGKIEPSLKSEEVPSPQTEPVFTLVGKQFTEVVTQGKDVFVEIYAPWCGHCKKLAPIWEELADKLKPFSSIVVAKFDGTANDIPAEHNVQVQGFPTVKLFRADGTIVDYEGDRSLEDLFHFIKKNAVNGASINIDVDGEADDDEKDEL